MGFIRRVFKHLFDASTPSAQAQIESLAGEVHSDVEVLDGYGIAVYPPADVTEGIAAFVNGNNDHGIILGWLDKKYRPIGLREGEVCIYSKYGQTIILRTDGTIFMTDASGSIFSIAGEITATPSSGVFRVYGDIIASGEIGDQSGTKTMSGMRGVYNGHTHGGSTTGSQM